MGFIALAAPNDAASTRVKSRRGRAPCPGLIEILRWDFGHAMSRWIFGRIAGIDEVSLAKMVDDDDRMDEIIAAASMAT